MRETPPRNTVVTGGSSGIGKNIIHEFHEPDSQTVFTTNSHAIGGVYTSGKTVMDRLAEILRLEVQPGVWSTFIPSGVADTLLASQSSNNINEGVSSGDRWSTIVIEIFN